MGDEIMNAYQDSIAEKFLKAMENGTAPWLRPWKSSPFTLRNGVTGHEYRGLNSLLLSIKPYEDPRYCTFIQAKQNNWMIKKGSQGQLIRYVMLLQRADENGDILEDEKPIFAKKYYTVFNFEQVEGVPELDEHEGEIKFDPIQRCEDVLKNFDVEIEEDPRSNRAFYRVNDDVIKMPNRERFESPLMFYRTAFHEMAHATGAKTRLGRKLDSFYDCDHAFEELIAEITSFLVGRALGCGSEPNKESVNYVASWMKIIKEDKAAIFRACRLAEQACDWILDPTRRK